MGVDEERDYWDAIRNGNYELARLILLKSLVDAVEKALEEPPC